MSSYFQKATTLSRVGNQFMNHCITMENIFRNFFAAVGPYKSGGTVYEIKSPQNTTRRPEQEPEYDQDIQNATEAQGQGPRRGSLVRGSGWQFIRLRSNLGPAFGTLFGPVFGYFLCY